MQSQIPAEELRRALPVVQALLANLAVSLQKLPPEADSALVYQPDLEPAE